ncbi:MAG: C40 family peptidase [Microthrixaceae bacterium]|nr:C40 family peptidase [Microthrixaceae bacterium]
MVSTSRFSFRFVASLCVTVVGLAVAPSVVAAQPPLSVTELRERAQSVAAQLQELHERGDNLDEAFLEAKHQVAQLQAELADKQQAVAAAEQQLGDQRAAAKRFALEAFVSGGEFDPVLMPVDQTTDVSNRSTYLESLQGDREDVIEDIRAARINLTDEQRKLDASKARIDAKVAALEKTRADIEATIAKQEDLKSSLSGQLAEAVAKEQARITAEREAAAERAARRAAELAAQAAARPVAAIPPRRSAPAYQSSTEPGASAPEVQLPDPGPVSPGVASVIAAAKSQLGVPYRWGASSPGKGFDCSGLVMYAWAQAGKSLPHSSRALFAMTERITADQLQPGDLTFGGNPVHHVGLYIGDGLMIHAPQTGDVVKISSIYSTSKPARFGRL